MHCVPAQQGCNDSLVVRDGTVDDACIMGILGMRTSFRKTRVTQLYLVLLPRYILATRTDGDFHRSVSELDADKEDWHTEHAGHQPMADQMTLLADQMKRLHGHFDNTHTYTH